ncbi:AAA family ATPase [Streptomyces sp. M19]
MYDRTRELEILSQALKDSTAGSGQLVIVTGGPGSGKTDLVYEFLNIAGAQGARVLMATATAAGPAQPLGVIGQLLHNGEVAYPDVLTMRPFRRR